MAVENKFFDSNLEAGTLADGAAFSGNSKHMIVEGSIAAADDNGSIYGLAVVNSSDIIFDITISNSAITGGTDYDIGLYNLNDDGSIGSAADADAYLDGASLASAATKTDGIADLAITNRNATVSVVAGESTVSGKNYVLALTGNTVGTAAGTVVANITTITQ